MKLYLVRHGETALNEKGCYYGKTDAVLSVRGIEQAKYLQHICTLFATDKKEKRTTIH